MLVPASPGRRIKGLEPEDRRRQRREELLDSALELFSTHGYATTSIEQVCQNATVGYKAFYEEFGTKEQLFIALYDTIGARLLPELIGVLDHQGPPEERLERMVSAYIHALMRDVRVAKVLFVTSAGVSETVDLHRRAAHRAFADFFAQLYIGGVVATGTTRPSNGRTMALGVTGGMGEIVVDFLLDPQQHDVDDLVSSLVAFIGAVVRGIGAAPAP